MQHKIWFDLSNSPHVLFFKPFIRELSRRKIKHVVTAREQEQLLELLHLFDIEYRIVGKYGGKNLLSKMMRMFERIFLLWLFAIKEKPNAVVVHQSFYGILAGFLAGVPKRIYIFDNEKAWIQNLLAIPFATHVVCPEVIPLKRMFMKKLLKYEGIKEMVYLGNFKPKGKEIATLFKELGISKNKKLLIFRPEPYTAHYYSSNKNLTLTLIRTFVDTGRWQVIIVPRDDKQREVYKKKYGKEKDVFVLERVVDLPSLIYYSDAVVSAGGTVAREAVVLGKHAASIFEGSTLAVDRWLSKNRLLLLVKDEEEAKKLPEIFSKPLANRIKSKNVDILRYVFTKN